MKAFKRLVHPPLLSALHSLSLSGAATDNKLLRLVFLGHSQVTLAACELPNPSSRPDLAAMSILELPDLFEDTWPERRGHPDGRTCNLQSRGVFNRWGARLMTQGGYLAAKDKERSSRYEVPSALFLLVFLNIFLYY